MALTAGKIRASYANLMFGDGSDPEIFTKLCGLRDNTLTITYATEDETDYDCADPEAPPVTIRNVGAQDWSISGSGLYNRAQAAALRDLEGVKANFRFDMAEPTVGGGVDAGYYEGVAIITLKEIGAAKPGFTQISITVQGAGKLTWVDA